MAYYGERPWHRLGRSIPQRANATQMIHAAGLDWTVAMRPIKNVGTHAGKEARRFQLIRSTDHESSIEVPLGVVSKRYRPLQNSEAFQFVDPNIGDKKAVFETAGSLGNGERVWVLAKVPGEIRVVGDDCCSKYLLLSNTHDGRGSISVKFTPVRVVCQNTLMLALESGETAHQVRHSKYMQDRLQTVQDLVRLTWNIFAKAEELFQSLARVQMNQARLITYLEAVCPLSQKQREANTTPERWEHVVELFEAGDAPSLPVSHTLWGAYNAIVRYEDYRRAKEAGPDRRLNRVWFGQGAALKLHALLQADQLGQRWLN